MVLVIKHLNDLLRLEQLKTRIVTYRIAGHGLKNVYLDHMRWVSFNKTQRWDP